MTYTRNNNNQRFCLKIGLLEEALKIGSILKMFQWFIDKTVIFFQTISS